MIINTRKHVWPAALVMSLAIVGVLAAFLVLAATPGSSSAHGGTPHDCSGLGGTNQGLHDAFANPGDDLCADSSAEPLDMPANLMADDQTVTSITISWDAVTGASGYRVEYMGPSHTVYQVYAGALQATSATIPDLEPGTRYSFKVTALGVTDVSSDSEAAMLQANTAAVAYELNLSTTSQHAVVSTVPTATGVDMFVVTIQRPDVSVLVNAEVETTSPRDTTSVSVRIENADDTMYLDEDPGITYVTSSGLRGVGPRSIDDGIMDIQIRDAASRVFTLDVTCDADNVATLRGVLDIEIRDDTATEVVAATILCAPPVEQVAPEERASACYAISGMPDRIGDDDRTAGVEFSDVELYTTDKSVQLRVISYEHSYSVTTDSNGVTTIAQTACPDWPQPSVFIRLVDTPGELPDMPMVDDEGGFVDENGLIDDHGEVVGVSSGGELVFDIEDTRDVHLTATESRSTGVREATFIVFTPEDVVVGDQYFVELYDYQETQRIEHLHRDPNRVRLYDRTRSWVGYFDGLTEVEQEYERVVYVASPDVLPTKLSVTTYSDRPGEALLSWTPVFDAEKHHAIVVHNGAAVPGSYAVVTLVGTDGRMSTLVTGLEENKEYTFAVIAENTDSDGEPQYSELAILSQEMDWEDAT